MDKPLDGRWLQTQRLDRGFTQDQLGLEIGVSQALISLWENNLASPSPDQVSQLWKIFGFADLAQTIQGASDTSENDVEGLDSSQSDGWGDYPLDSVFVRTDQRTVGDVVRRINASRYDLNPDFQRDFVWSLEKQSRLIESCIMRIPLPVLYVAEAEDGRIIVVDGLQRLTTFKRFIGNEFKLTFAESEDMKKHPLQGIDYKHLDLKLQERIDDTQLTLYILDSKAPERAKLDIFDRVNSGEPLSRQQMRNCLYNGAATSWLRDAAKSESFLTATGGSLDSKRMRDREAINRFCAFSLLGWRKYRSGDMDRFLADGLEGMNKMSEKELATLQGTFTRAMDLNFKLFGRHAFRKSLNYDHDSNRSVLNIALFDVCTVVLPAVLSDRDKPLVEAPIRNAMKSLLDDPLFVQAITYSTNSRKQVEQRFTMMESLVEEVV